MLRVAVLLCGALAGSASAQTVPITAADVVRVSSSAHDLSRTRFVVQDVTHDALLVVPIPAPSPPLSIALADVDRLDVQRGRHSRWRGALLWGLGAGLVSSVIAGSVASGGGGSELTVPLAGWIGSGAGALYGSRRDPTRWERVRVPVAEASVGAAGGGGP